MGIIIAKFRKKKTTYEVLEKLDGEIKSIEEFGRDTEQTQKKIVKRFIIISILVYIITGVVIYVYFFPASAYERLFYVIPLIITPVLLLFIKRILTWHYNRKMSKNQKKLTSLKDEKKKILDDVMDKETYKVAKTILEKFAPEQVIRRNTTPTEMTPIRSSLAIAPSGQTNLRYRGTPPLPTPQTRFVVASTPYGAPSPLVRRPLMPNTLTPGPVRTSSDSRMVPSPASRVPGSPLHLPREILPRDRSVLDKMVDYLVGDGPANRFALICRNCSSHNGMALKEEFDYLSFRCCYCMTFNPARKQRPAAPKLENTLAIKGKISDASDSDQSDSDSEKEGPIVSEPPSDSEQHQNTKEVDVEKEAEVAAMEVDTSEVELVDEETISDSRIEGNITESTITKTDK